MCVLETCVWVLVEGRGWGVGGGRRKSSFSPLVFFRAQSATFVSDLLLFNKQDCLLLFFSVCMRNKLLLLQVSPGYMESFGE